MKKLFKTNTNINVTKNLENRKEGKTMKKTHAIKTRIFAAALSVMVLFSASGTAITNIFAAGLKNNNTITTSKYKGNTLYYSDSYFEHPSTEYDPHLATLSCIMTNFSVPLDNPKSLKDDKWYLSQPERLFGFFGSIGFNEFETNEDYVKRSAFDTIGVAAASKKIGDYTVIGVGIRSGGYFLEWGNNVYLGTGKKSDYMHEGWYNAANKTIAFLDSYIASKNIKGKVKVWIAGFSRGGATTNLAAGLLDNKIDKNEKIFSNGATLAHDDLYAYTFEAPQGANYNSKTVKLPGDPIYNNIWNIVNPNDLVPKVAMSEYGFTRFGTDKFITTRFFDPEGFKNNRNVFKSLYVENGSSWDSYKADNFEMYGTPLKKVGSLVLELFAAAPAAAMDTFSRIKRGDNPVLEKDSTKVHYDANFAAYLLLEELTKNIGSRENYCKKYQDGVKNFMLALMNDVKAVKKEELSCILSRLLLCAAASSSIGFGSYFKEGLKEMLPNAQIDQIIDSIKPILSVVGKVYWERPNELISVGLYISEIFQNHDNGVNIAHLEAQDSYYIDNYNSKNDAHLSLVGLRDSADFGRVSFKDYNDIGLYNNNGKKNFVQVQGAKAKNSVITNCNEGFAVGYYSYATEEKMELFVPVNQKYILNMKGYSIKPRHDVWYTAIYQSVSPNSLHRFKDDRGHFADWYVMNTDFLQRGVNMNY